MAAQRTRLDFRKGFFFILFFAASHFVHATGVCDPDNAILGKQVAVIAKAIHDPSYPGAMEHIKKLGTDSRYYTMIRGWLSQQLWADESIIAASGFGNKPVIEARIAFIEEAIRAIDLELL